MKIVDRNFVNLVMKRLSALFYPLMPWNALLLVSIWILGEPTLACALPSALQVKSGKNADPPADNLALPFLKI
jgi:hypothetical protein